MFQIKNLYFGANHKFLFNFLRSLVIQSIVAYIALVNALEYPCAFSKRKTNEYNHNTYVNDV